MVRLIGTLVVGAFLMATVAAQDPPPDPIPAKPQLKGRGGRGAAVPKRGEADNAASESDALPAGAIARLGSAPRSDRLPPSARNASALAFSPDGRLVATSGAEVRLWDAMTGREVRTLPAQAPVGDAGAAVLADVPSLIRSTALAFAPDGKTVAAINTTAAASLTPVAVWDTATGRPVASWRLSGTDRSTSGSPSLAYTTDGKSLVGVVYSMGVRGAAAARGLSLVFWDPATGKEQRQISLGPVTSSIVPTALAVSPDGRTLAAAVAGNPVQLIELATGQVRDELSLERPGGRRGARAAGRDPQSLQFSPDGRTLYTIGADGAIVGHDLVTGRKHRFGGAQAGSPLYVSTDGKWLAARAADATVRVYDAATGRLRQRIGDGRRFSPTPQSFGLSSDGATVATDEGTGLRLIDVATGRDRTAAAGHTGAVTSLTFTRDGQTLVSVGTEQAIAWEVARRAATAVRATDEDRIVAREVSADGARLAEATFDGQVAVIEMATGQTVHEFNAGRRLGTLAFAPDGRTLVGAEASTQSLLADPRPIRQWNLTAGAAGPLLDAGTVATARLSFSPDGKRLIGADVGGGARVWEWPGGRLLWQVPPSGARVGSPAPAVSPDGRTLVLASGTGALRLFDAATGKPAGELEGHSNGTTAVTFAPDGRTLATGGADGLVRVWDVESGLALHHLTGHTGNVTALAYSPDGTVLASGGADTSILLWDATRLGWPAAATPPPAPDLTPEQLVRCWDDLASADAKTAYQAVRLLAGSPGASVPRLKELVRPAERLDAAQLAALVADLDHDQFARRQKATEALAALGSVARDALRAHLAGGPSAEARQRAEELLKRLDEPPSGEELRQLRAVEALERMATPAARTLLEEFAKGQPGATLTREAEAALRRMGQTK